MNTFSTATIPRSVDDLVLHEQIALTCQQYGMMAASSVVADSLMLFLFYGKVPTLALVSWFIAAVAGVGFVQLAIYIVARRAGWKFDSARHWTVLLTVTAFIGGTAWGSAGVLLFVSTSLIDQQLLLIFLIGGASLVMVMMAAYPPAFYAAVIPMLAPITARLLTTGDTASMMLGIIPVAYGATLIYFYKNIHRTLLESLRLRFELTRMTEALAVQKHRAEAADLAKSRFLAAASHDLRQPLHAQGLFLEELQALTHDTEGRRIVESLKRSMDAMHEQFNSLLDISQLDASVVEPKQETFSIRILLRALSLDFFPLAREKGLMLRIVDSSALVNSDPMLLKRILCNLVSNAIRYTNQGKVLVGCRRRANQLRIEVWDTGIGIDAADRESIFEEFHQLHNPERNRRQGLGLGLAIVDRLANLLRSPIEVISQVNKGSKFSVAVPFAGTATTEIPPPSVIVERVDDLSGCTILVIDDEPEILRGMRGLLEQWGCQVLAAESTAQAISHVRASACCPAAIIADYRLRDHENGADAITRLRSLVNKEVPGILITGDTGSERLQEAYASGYRVLHKPVPPAKLRALLSYITRTSPPLMAHEENST